MIRTCRRCPEKQEVDNPDCYVSPQCTLEIAAEAAEALQRARQEASRLFIAAALQRNSDGAALADVAQRVADFPDEYAPHIWEHFEMTLTEFSERLALASAEAIDGTPVDARWRVGWWVPCVAPFYDWWWRQGWTSTVRIPDAKPEADEDPEGANSPFVDFLIFELGRLGADRLATPNGVKKLDRAVRDLAKPGSTAP